MSLYINRVMENSYLESKIMNLQAKLKAENESLPRDNLVTTLCSPKHNPVRSRPSLGDIGTPTRPRKQLDLPVGGMMQLKSHETTEVDRKMKEIMKLNGILSINGKKYHTDIKDLEDMGELGNGTCGHVVKMLHRPSERIIAVKQMRRSGNSDENKRIIMDLDVVFKSLDCPYIVRYLGCFITESDVWICMELMATCFDRLLKKLQSAIPEDILGKVALATVRALHYLKESHGIIHRDVKPSNILLDEKGNVKLCDFGISGRLVDSKARTKNAGCAAYMAPERIEPPDPRKPDYDIRADVWSLGITLVELATGVFPYKDCKCDFEVLTRVLHEDPPSLPADSRRFSNEFRSFVTGCLTKDYRNRPKYNKLMEHPFLKRYEIKHVDVAAWYAEAVSDSSNSSTLRYIPTALSTSTRRQPPPPPPLTTAHQSRDIGIETLTNGDSLGRYSPNKLNLNDMPYSGANGMQLSEWDPLKYSGYVSNTNKYTGSPSMSRRRYQDSGVTSMFGNSYSSSNNGVTNSSVKYGSSENTSPLVLQRFYHQQSQHYNNYTPSYPNAPSHYRSTSLSPSRRYEEMRATPPPPAMDERVRKRFSSYLKFQLTTAREQSSPSPPPNHPPSPAPPSPPPRLGRIGSPIARRYESSSASPTASRRLFGDGSPIFSKRYVSACPPQPPPRRFSESSSVPGSPQHFLHRRNTPSPNRFHCTQQPHCKAIYQINDL